MGLRSPENCRATRVDDCRCHAVAPDRCRHQGVHTTATHAPISHDARRCGGGCSISQIIAIGDGGQLCSQRVLLQSPSHPRLLHAHPFHFEKVKSLIPVFSRNEKATVPKWDGPRMAPAIRWDPDLASRDGLPTAMRTLVPHRAFVAFSAKVA
jgi:hypothetical protein